MFKKLKQTKRNYLNNTSGQFGVWFAVVAFPMLVATSAVVDFRKAEANRAGIKGALDTAVLTAVSNNSISDNAKITLAKDVFNANYVGTAVLELDVAVSDGRVEMDAKGYVPTSISKSVGFSSVDVTERSVAEMNRTNTICVLALAEEGDEKLRFLGATEFNSPTCSVQSNSKSAFGAKSDTNFTPVAKSFCSAGGATGAFSPSIRGECRVIDDPYKDRTAPKPGVCMPQEIFDTGPGMLNLGNGLSAISGNAGLPINGHEPGIRIVNTGNGNHTHRHCHLENGSCHSSNHSPLEIHAPSEGLRLDNLGVSLSQVTRLVSDYGMSMFLQPESVNYTRSNSVYAPGTYCGGLTVDGENVTFLPGVYIMKDGPLTFKNGATADAQEVSFVLHGDTSVVTVESGSYVNIKAPRTGEMAGLAFYQDVSTTKVGKNAQQALPTGVNLISSGGELNVTGTMYFPEQALDVVGQSTLGARAPATSFIAHQVTFADASKASVSVDHIKGGIPPMLPRSDDGARLVE